MRLKPRSSWYYLLIPLVIVLDQTTKYFAKFLFEISCNKGVAFGIGFPSRFSIVIPVVTLVVVFFLLLREKRASMTLPFGIIFAGGFSNLLDRILAGCVRDFINLGIWPAFNLADSAITMGVLLLAYSLILRKSNE